MEENIPTPLVSSIVQNVDTVQNDDSIQNDDLVFDDDIVFDDDQYRWTQLLDWIDRGNVIPVIGPDLLVEPKVIEGDNDRKENLHQQIISYIAKRANVKSKPRTFSQLVYDNNFRAKANNKTKRIYSLINQIMKKLHDNKEINHEPSQLLMDLLGTKRFPFVITTSFTPIVEQAMEKIWGEGNVRILKFTNNPNANETKDYVDIKTKEDLKHPTVFYMLGKYCDNPEKYVVTDSDMMVYCKSWIKGYGTPKTLINALKNKYLLILGNSYSDWLYRFVWFALRSTPDEMKSDVIVNEDAEDSLIQFLERLQTLYHDDPSKVIHEIKEKMESKPINEKYDVFLSYSRNDSVIARNLFDALTDKGLRVWFDKESIKAGDWKEAQDEGVKRSRLFIPILTSNIEKEILDSHEYRNEWNLAAELSKIMGGRTFIIPFAEQGFDFYDSLNKLPKEFHKMNAIWFSDENDVQGIVNTIIEELKKLKELENTLKQ